VVACLLAKPDDKKSRDARLAVMLALPPADRAHFSRLFNSLEPPPSRERADLMLSLGGMSREQQAQLLGLCRGEPPPAMPASERAAFLFSMGCFSLKVGR
jgi:hypothetical protein